MDFLDQIIHLIDSSIDENCALNITEGGIIKEGYNTEVDEYRSILHESHKWVSEYQQTLVEESGIKSLKVKYTWNIWYFIEVSKNSKLSEEEGFIHKQTLSNVHRYSSKTLMDFEVKVQNAESFLADKEYDIFLTIRNSVASYYNDIYKLSRNTAYTDYLVNGAYISGKYNYVSPKISETFTVEIEWWKHPVISVIEKEFISNSASFSKKDRVHVITWPNMWGKSTFLRQNALLILMAHMWYDVPARTMTTPIVDKIFSRVGSGDNLYLGQSTFMVEMQEMSFILRSATNKSFIIIDEIGRGTSTLDGMSLAWAILKYIHDVVWAKTIFATHYHELIDHSKTLSWVGNFSVAVGENSESLVFLRKIIPGGMKKSYGIEVAKLAGINNDILDSARSILREFESSAKGDTQLQIGLDSVSPTIKTENHIPIMEKIMEASIDDMTPLEALHFVNQLKELVKKTK